MTQQNTVITTLPTAYRTSLLEVFKDLLIDKGYADLGRLRAMYIHQLCAGYFLVRIRINDRQTEQIKITWQRHLANLACHEVNYYS